MRFLDTLTVELSRQPQAGRFQRIVCAQHEHEHTLLKALNKFEKYKFYGQKVALVLKWFQRVQVPYGRGYRLEPLVSRKTVYREVYVEGSETTKSGTDEQKLDKRL